MADPLSIAASVTGLLTVAVKVSSVISGFIASVNDVPDSARSALTTVTEMRFTLLSVRELIEHLSQLPRERKAMIHVQHLVVVFHEAILSLSKLEAVVCPPVEAGTTGMSKWDTVKWLLEEKKILAAVQRLETHKSSLSAMLNVLQCKSDIEAQECLNKLQKTVQDLVDKNESLLRRLEQFDPGQFEETSVRFFGDESILRREGLPSLAMTNRTSVLSPSTEASMGSMLFPKDFEVTLERTRVYARVQSNDCDVSFSSSAIRSTAWSILSGLSLNDISVISVIALPISLDEVKDIGSHLTFARILSGPTGMTSGFVGPSQPPLSLQKSDNTLPHTGNTSTVPHPSPQPRAGSPKGPAYRAFWRRKPLPDISETKAESSGVPDPSPRQYSVLTPRAARVTMDLHKLVVLGDGGTGKTDLTIQLCLNHFIETYDPSIEDSYRKQAVIDGKACILEVLDTAGQEEYTALRDQWIRDGEGFVIVYSVTSRTTFRRVTRFYNQVRRIKDDLFIHHLTPPPLPNIVLVGNNIDRVTEREVSYKEGSNLARELGCGFVESSARNCVNVEKPFYDLVRELRRQEQSNRTYPVGLGR